MPLGDRRAFGCGGEARHAAHLTAAQDAEVGDHSPARSSGARPPSGLTAGGQLASAPACSPRMSETNSPGFQRLSTEPPYAPGVERLLRIRNTSVSNCKK